MKKLFLLSIVFLGFGLGVRASAATYYVAKTGSDANTCSQALPCLTIAKGVSKLVSGDILIIKAGTYVENIGPGIPGGTSWRTATTIKTNAGDTVVIRPTTGAAVDIRATGQQYIVFGGPASNEGFVVDCTDTAIAGDYTGVAIQDAAHHIRVQHNEVKNCAWSKAKRGPATVDNILYADHIM